MKRPDSDRRVRVEKTRPDLRHLLRLVDERTHDSFVSEANIRTKCLLRLSKRGTALLVGGEDLVRMSTAAVLVEHGYDALSQLRAGLDPSLIVTDHLMV